MRRLTTLTATLTAITALAACSDASDTAGSTDADTPAAGSSTPAEPTTEGSADFTVIGSPYLTGPGHWAMEALGDPQADLAVFDVPADFQGHEQWIWFDVGDGSDRDFGQMMYLAPTSVPSDPCRPGVPAPALGDGVDAFADALAAQGRTTTTRPVEVSLSGHDGLYLELTTPAERCPRKDQAYVAFLAGADDGRELEPASTDRYWVLDVDGHRVVISAMTPRNGTPAAVRRVRGMAESVTFAPAT